ncbi:magnesium/cobalt transporter CorA [bacterium]|nr:magnesium/cobalt transporter CorA [bacterium]
MARFIKSRVKAKGAASGSLIFIGKQTVENPRIRLFRYDQESTNEKEYQIIEEALDDINSSQINWLNIDGLHDTSIIESVGKHFDISSLALENVLNTGQRSKFFEDKNSLTLISKAVYFNPETKKISVEQISFILCDHVLVSFQEKPGDHFEPVRERIRHHIGRIRRCSEDYLLHALIDSLVDNYLIDIEQIGAQIEALELRLTLPDKQISNELFHYKTEIAYFRKTIRPQKEVITRLLRSGSSLIHPETKIYFQELNDLIEYANDTIDIYFNMIGDQVTIYNTNINNRVNKVMKVLTIFASIFIPLTFIAGVYGTNFHYLPELQFKYSYFIMWGIMVLVALVMLIYFKMNKWF